MLVGPQKSSGEMVVIDDRNSYIITGYFGLSGYYFDEYKDSFILKMSKDFKILAEKNLYCDRDLWVFIP